MSASWRRRWVALSLIGSLILIGCAGREESQLDAASPDYAHATPEEAAFVGHALK